MDETAATRYHSRPLNPKFFKFCARSSAGRSRKKGSMLPPAKRELPCRAIRRTGERRER